MVEQVQAGQAGELFPARVLGQRMLAEDAVFGIFMLHLDEQEQYQFGDVVGVIDAVVAQDVAQVPEFLDNIVVAHRGVSWFKISM